MTTTAIANPSTQRIHELDVLRGLAVLGIFWVNIIVFSLPSGVYSYPTLFSHGNDLNIAVWAFNDIFVEGTMRGLFSMLFGASAMIFLDESRTSGPDLRVVDRFYRRNILLIIFGMLHAYVLLWPYDVLYVYGLLGMFLFPLRKLSARTLLIMGCTLLILADIPFTSTAPQHPDRLASLSVTDDAQTKADPRETAERDARIRERLLPNIREEIRFRQADYATIFTTQIPDVIAQESSVIYTTNFFDMGGMMLVGIALFRFGVLSGRRSTRFYIGLAIFGYLVGVLSRGVPLFNILSHANVSFGMPPFDGIDYTFSRLPLALAHASVIMLLCRVRWLRWFTKLLAPIGRMALTSYILQTAISIFIFYGFGLGMFGRFERYELIYFCLGMWVFHSVFSLMWLSYFQQGPLEWIWRSLIYAKRQPFRKAPVDTYAA